MGELCCIRFLSWHRNETRGIILFIYILKIRDQTSTKSGFITKKYHYQHVLGDFRLRQNLVLGNLEDLQVELAFHINEQGAPEQLS